MFVKSFTLVAFTLLVACGGDSVDVANDKIQNKSGGLTTATESDKSLEAEQSKLHKFMSESRICEAIDHQKLIEAFNIKTELNTITHETNGNYSCDYFWDLPDEVVMSRMQLMSQLKSSGSTDESLIKRLRYGSGEVSVSLIKSSRNASNFVPMNSDVQLLQAQLSLGVLNVYTNGLEVLITARIADTQTQDTENAKTIYQLLNL